jgi:hypothetical protein
MSRVELAAKPIARAVADAVIDKLGSPVTRAVTRPIDEAASRRWGSWPGAAPLIDLVDQAVSAWIRPGNEGGGFADFQARVIELGHKAMELATPVK